jgi:hypothetical protein
MSKASEENSLLAIKLIEEQLQVLPLSIAMILRPADAGNLEPGMASNLMRLRRKTQSLKTGSGGNIVADKAQPDTALDFDTSHQALQKNPQLKTNFLRIVISNALLAVGIFLKEHAMGSMRTPEIQFLEHIVDAILNDNTFKIDPGYMPIATFDGLVIDNELNGAILFSDGIADGFMEFGDAVALLQWLSRYLRGEKNFVTGGDAG